MTNETTSAKRPAQHWLIAVLLTTVPLVLCLGAALWAEFTPHYMPLDRVNLFDVGEWSSVTVTTITRNDNHFSIWSGEAAICAAQPNLCQGNNHAEIIQQLTNWFTQHGWQTVQRDPATGWNVCDKLSTAQKQSDLVFEPQGGMYYEPTACVTVDTNSTLSSSSTIQATTINPSPFTSWSD